MNDFITKMQKLSISCDDKKMVDMINSAIVILIDQQNKIDRLSERNKLMIDDMFNTSNSLDDMTFSCLNLIEGFNGLYQLVLTTKQKKHTAVELLKDGSEAIKKRIKDNEHITNK